MVVNNKVRNFGLIISLPLVLALASGCFLEGDDGSDGADGVDGVDGADGPAGPTGPVISSISTVGSPASPGGQIQILVSAHSADGADLSYSWDIPEGWTGESDTDVLVLDAPDDEAVSDRVDVVVDDGERESSGSVLVATSGLAFSEISMDPEPPVADGATFFAQALNTDGAAVEQVEWRIADADFGPVGNSLEWSNPGVGGYYIATASTSDSQGREADISLSFEAEQQMIWPMYGNDQLAHSQSGNSEDDAVGEERFAYEVEEFNMQGHAAIDEEGNAILVAEDGFVRAFDGSPEDPDDPLLWSVDLEDQLRAGVVIDGDGIVYATTFVQGVNGGSDVVAIDPSQDEGDRILWRFNVEGAINRSPAIDNQGVLYVGDNENTFYAIDTSAEDLDDEDRLLWDYDLGEDEVAWSAPSIGADGSIYFGDTNGTFYALDNTTEDIGDEERELWTYTNEEERHFQARAVIGSDGTIYVGSFDNYLYALDSSREDLSDEDRVLWRFDTEGNIQSSAAIDGDMLYIGSRGNSGGLYALDLSAEDESDRLVWSFKGITQGIWAAPAVSSSGMLYVAAGNGNLMAIDPEGETEDDRLVWEFNASAIRIESSPAIGHDGTIYFSEFFNADPDVQARIYAVE